MNFKIKYFLLRPLSFFEVTDAPEYTELSESEAIQHNKPVDHYLGVFISKAFKAVREDNKFLEYRVFSTYDAGDKKTRFHYGMRYNQCTGDVIIAAVINEREYSLEDNDYVEFVEKLIVPEESDIGKIVI